MEPTATVRETKEVEISGHKLVVLTYITGRELREAQRTLMERLELVQGSNGSKPEVSGIKGDLILIQQNKYIELIVKSIDGKTENILDTVLDLPSTASVAITNYVSAIAEGKDPATN